MASRSHRFTARLFRPEGVGTWSFVRVPAAVTKAFGKRGRVPVTGAVEGVPLEGSLMPDGEGGHFVVVNTAIREKAGVQVGDRVELELRQDTAAREVAVPPELRAALRQSAPARKAFAALAYSHRKAYADWIAQAKKDETRVARASKAAQLLAAGKRLR